MKNFNGIKILEITTLDLTAWAFLKPLIKDLEKNGFNVTIAAKDTGFTSTLKKEGFKVENFPFKRSYNIFSHLYSIIVLKRYIKRENFMIIHTHTSIASLVGRVSAKLNRVPIIINTIHGIPFDEKHKIGRFLYFLMEKLLSRITDLTFITNQNDLNTLLSKKIIEPKKLVHINSVGVDLNIFNPFKIDESKEEIKKNLNIEKDSIVITTVARLTKEKGIIEFIKAFNKIVNKYFNVYFLIVGSSFEGDKEPIKEEEIKNIIDDRYKEKLIFLGFRKDIPKILKASDIFVLASYREGMPKSILEAMAMYLPVVASDISGNKEEVVDGETGFLFLPGDYESLTNILMKLIEDNELRKKMGIKGRERVEELFDEKRIIDLQIEKICNLIKNKECITKN